MALGRRGHRGGHRGRGFRGGWGGGWGYPGWYSPLTYVQSSETYCPIHADQCALDCPHRRRLYRLGESLAGEFPPSAFGQPEATPVPYRESWCPVHQHDVCPATCKHRRWARGMGENGKDGGTSNASVGLGTFLLVGLAFFTGYIAARD
jgi:hypothetical protein